MLICLPWHCTSCDVTIVQPNQKHHEFSANVELLQIHKTHQKTNIYLLAKRKDWYEIVCGWKKLEEWRENMQYYSTYNNSTRQIHVQFWMTLRQWIILWSKLCQIVPSVYWTLSERYSRVLSAYRKEARLHTIKGIIACFWMNFD